MHINIKTSYLPSLLCFVKRYALKQVRVTQHCLPVASDYHNHTHTQAERITAESCGVKLCVGCSFMVCSFISLAMCFISHMK